MLSPYRFILIIRISVATIIITLDAQARQGLITGNVIYGARHTKNRLYIHVVLQYLAGVKYTPRNNYLIFCDITTSIAAAAVGCSATIGDI